MTLRRWKDRVLGIPWVYDVLRPLAVGGIDHAALAEFCAVGPEDRVFDLGCGTAQLLDYLRCGSYLGVDPDPAALERAARFSAPRVRFLEGEAWDDAYRSLAPTVVLMIGLVHHVADAAFGGIVSRLRHASPGGAERIVTLDVTYFPGAAVNNLLSRLDRGRYVRRPGEYERLFVNCDLRVLRRETLSTRLRYVRYVGFHLSLGGEQE